MPLTAALGTLIASLVGASATAATSIYDVVNQPSAPKTPTAAPAAPPAPITAPSAPQLQAAANSQAATGGGAGAAPDYLEALLQNTSGGAPTSNIDLSQLQGFLAQQG